MTRTIGKSIAQQPSSKPSDGSSYGFIHIDLSSLSIKDTIEHEPRVFISFCTRGHDGDSSDRHSNGNRCQQKLLSGRSKIAKSLKWLNSCLYIVVNTPTNVGWCGVAVGARAAGVAAWQYWSSCVRVLVREVCSFVSILQMLCLSCNTALSL